MEDNLEVTDSNWYWSFFLPWSYTTHKMDIFRFNTNKFTPVVSGLCSWLLDCTGLPQDFSSPRASSVLDGDVSCRYHCEFVPNV